MNDIVKLIVATAGGFFGGWGIGMAVNYFFPGALPSALAMGALFGGVSAMVKYL